MGPQGGVDPVTVPEQRRPDVVDGELVDVRPAPPSPLDPDRSGTWPTVLRPVPLDQHDVERPGLVEVLRSVLRGGAR